MQLSFWGWLTWHMCNDGLDWRDKPRLICKVCAYGSWNSCQDNVDALEMKIHKRLMENK